MSRVVIDKVSSRIQTMKQGICISCEPLDTITIKRAWLIWLSFFPYFYITLDVL